MSEKDSEDDKWCWCLPLSERSRRVAKCIASVILLISLIIFIVWLILRPIAKPRFVLEDASIYSFNISSPYRLSSNLQVTLSSENSMSRIAIYYDTIDAYASYRGQQITLPTLLPSAFQGHKDLTVWSPVLYGDSVPIAPYYGDAFLQDQMAGIVLIHFKVSGKIRFKLGTFITAPYNLDVTCPAYVSFGNNDTNRVAIPIGPLMKFRLVESCNVEV